MAEYYVCAGNTWPPVEFVLLRNGKPHPLTNVSAVQFRYRPKNGGTWVVRTAVVMDAEKAIVQYEWQTGETAVAGEYVFKFRVVYASGKEEDFPNDVPCPFVITPDV